MKFYLYQGEGVTLSSTVIVRAKDAAEAKALITECIDYEGLKMSDDIVELKLKGSGVLYFDNGDY